MMIFIFKLWTEVINRSLLSVFIVEYFICLDISIPAGKNPRPYDGTYLNDTFFKRFGEVQFLSPGFNIGDDKD